MKTGFITLLSLCLLRCNADPQYAYHGQDQVRVSVSDEEWTPEQRAEIWAELHALEPALRITFTASVSAEANVAVRAYVGPCQDWSGWSICGTENVYVRTACMHSTHELRMVVGHEVGHWLGMMHLPTTEHGIMSQWPESETITAADQIEFHRATGR